jgi:hypothetical protein
VAVASFSTNCDLDIWVAIVSPLIRYRRDNRLTSAGLAASAQLCWVLQA